MEFLRRLAHKINSNVISRNLVLAICAILVFLFVANLLLNLFTRHGQVRIVPDFSGMTIEEAAMAGQDANLNIDVIDSLYVPVYEGGVILEQTPSSGSEVKSGRRILVTVNSFKQKTVTVPYVTGYSLRQAKNNLELAGLNIERLIYQSDMAHNNVIEERYDGRVISSGSKVEAEIGSGVTLVVGLGEGTTSQAVPRLVGFKAREARSRLWEAGFNVGEVKYDQGVNLLNEKDAKVYLQSPNVGTYLGYGTPVSFSLTMDDTTIEKSIAESAKAERAAAKAKTDSLSALNN